MREEENGVCWAMWSCQDGDLILSGGSGVLGIKKTQELRPWMISEVVKLRSRCKVWQGWELEAARGSSRQLGAAREGEHGEAARWVQASKVAR